MRPIVPYVQTPAYIRSRLDERNRLREMAARHRAETAHAAADRYGRMASRLDFELSTLIIDGGKKSEVQTFRNLRGINA